MIEAFVLHREVSFILSVHYKMLEMMIFACL
jgi:hypothetical protein